jgi:hypothetical protein
MANTFEKFLAEQFLEKKRKSDGEFHNDKEKKRDSD